MTADEYFAQIKTGHANALKRPDNARIDRALRKKIEFANLNGDLIISGDKGYYRPDFEQPFDVLEYNGYIQKEKERLMSIENKLKAMTETATRRIC